MVLKYYYDLISEPSRALYILLKINKIPFKKHPVNLLKFENLTDEFKTKLNRFQKVPFIHDNDFILTESIAIVRYLSREYGIKDSLYPQDSKHQALVDEYLEWQHHNTRLLIALYTRHKLFKPLLTGDEPDLNLVSKYKRGVVKTMDKIENLWLRDQKFICGNILTVADIFAACEIEQPRMTGFDPTKGRPKLETWMNEVRKELDPVYSEAHLVLNELAANNEKAKL
ncbi:hypothetical protein WA026_000075 [Henosepilachna vigintioctopunctata]|uniref:Uncharacterized protein n=1 Tax=Henosepilachna vigintioctopunctata TaxID=420089 RepID=A0AAW1V2Q6_9CUCU